MIYGLIVILVGVFCTFCAYKDFDWFMGSTKAWLFVKLFGRKGARIFYMIIGILFCLGGSYFAIAGV
ncbi:MAG: hypothetical protein K6B74_10685 [Ruminococcus sp.]|nr:hypothetical protein [Ruminococcus sp.]